MNEYRQLMRCYWQGKAEVLVEKLSECHFVSLPGLGLNPDLYGERLTHSCLSHGMIIIDDYPSQDNF